MDGCLQILFPEHVIRDRVKQLGARLSEEMDGLNPLLVGVLTGAFVFAADLARTMTCPAQVDFIAASSYGKGTASSGSVSIIKDLTVNPEGRHIIIVEDIVDSGLTLATLARMLEARGAASVKFVALIDKKARREHKIPELTAVGFDCPDLFVVGYGIDWADRYRCLPYVGVLKPSVYTGAAPAGK